MAGKQKPKDPENRVGGFVEQPDGSWLPVPNPADTDGDDKAEVSED